MDVTMWRNAYMNLTNGAFRQIYIRDVDRLGQKPLWQT